MDPNVMDKDSQDTGVAATNNTATSTFLTAAVYRATEDYDPVEKASSEEPPPNR